MKTRLITVALLAMFLASSLVLPAVAEELYQQATRFRSLLVSGDIDVDGVSNLDVTDVDGAADFASTATIAGNIDANGDLDVDGTSNLDVLDVDDTADFSTTLTVGGILTANGAIDANSTADFVSTVAVGTDLTVGGDFLVSAQTAISVTDGSVITPTGTYQPLESAGAVTGTLSTSGFTTGTQLILINTVDQTIIISETSTSQLSGNTSLGQYDSLHLWFDGTNWIEIGQADN